MTTEELAKVVDRCKSDAPGKTIDDLPAVVNKPAPAERSPVEAGADYVAQLRKDDDKFFRKLEKVAKDFIRGLYNARTRRDGIDYLKLTHKHHGTCGGGVDYEGSPKGLTMQYLSSHPITRSWTEVWDMLAIIALRRYEETTAREEDLNARIREVEKRKRKLDDARVLRWESRGVTPPEDKPILTMNLTNAGTVYRAAVWDGRRFVDPANRKKELTGLQFHMWIEIPFADEIARPAEEPTGQMMIFGWMPGGTNPALPCDVVAEFSVDDEYGKATMQMLCRWDGSTFCFKAGGSAVDMQPVRWIELPE
jgi:hypothetical protein